VHGQVDQGRGGPGGAIRALRSTNAIESMINICRDHARNVKRWREGQMALRWCAADTVEASAQFRRVNGHLHLPALRAALERHVATTLGRYSPVRSLRNGSIGSWCECGRPPRPDRSNGNGFTIGPVPTSR